MTTPDGNVTKRHLIFSLNVDTGTTNVGWPVSVEGTSSGGVSFSSIIQNERGALGIVGGRLYVPYGGHFGDCGAYHGWLIGVNLSNPADVIGWATRATGGSATGAGSWAVGGVASDGVNPFIATGNTFSAAGVWRGGEAIIKLQPGPVFTGATTDFWAPPDWSALDGSDTDLGGTGALMVDVPGATPSQLVVAFGKDRDAYVMNRNNLGGVSAPIAEALDVSASAIIQAPATYRTSMGTYVTFRGSNSIGALRINPTNPPTITSAWSVSQPGRGSPFVTTTDGTNNAIVWAVGSENSQRLMGWNGDTGAVVFNGGGANELMSATRRFNTGIAARGRIYFAADNRVYAFMLPGGTSPTPTNTPTNTATNTPTATPTAPSGSISGTVTYVNAASPPVFVSNALISGAGSPNVSTTTAAPGPIAGQYTLTGFGEGSYTVTPTKTGGANGISSFDSARVAQHVAGVTPLLNANQQIAGDASGNGQLSSFDAGQIAQYVVNGTGGHSSEWTFLPANRFYPSVTSPMTGEDYSAILIGEVSGSWNNTGARAVRDDSVQATVELPMLNTELNKEIIVPVTVRGVAGMGVISYEFDLRYDASVLQVASDPIDTKATSSRGLFYLTNSQEPGLLRVIMYGPMPIEEDGLLVNLKFTAVGAPGSVSPLMFDRFMFNEGEPGVMANRSQIQLSQD